MSLLLPNENVFSNEITLLLASLFFIKFCILKGTAVCPSIYGKLMEVTYTIVYLNYEGYCEVAHNFSHYMDSGSASKLSKWTVQQVFL
jgi:hypothetical protein